MSREWKPGDVAMIRCDDRDCNVGEHPAIRSATSGDWWLLDQGEYLPPSETEVVRLLVIIDPEDREDVLRLRATMLTSGGDLVHALREFADPTPPKPDEPTGLGAVVEAIYDNRFVRVDLGPEAWRRVGDLDMSNLCRWSDIAAVKVLSEGVQP